MRWRDDGTIGTYIVLSKDGGGAQSEQSKRRPLEVDHCVPSSRRGVDEVEKEKNEEENPSTKKKLGSKQSRECDSRSRKKVMCAIWPWSGNPP